MITAMAVLMLCAGSSSAGMWLAVTLSGGLDRAMTSATVLRTHMGADMMHDALRADVLASLLGGDVSAGLSPEENKAAFEEHKAAFEKEIATNEGATVSDATRRALQDVRQPLQDYIEGAGSIITLAASNVAAANAGMPKFLEQFKQLEGAMERVTEHMTKAAESDVAAAKSTAAFAKIVMGGLLALSTLLALMLMGAAPRVIVTPIVAITEALDRLSAGDLSVHLPVVHAQDEIGRMAAALISFKNAVAGRNRAPDIDTNGRLIPVSRAT